MLLLPLPLYGFLLRTATQFLRVAALRDLGENMNREDNRSKQGTHAGHSPMDAAIHSYRYHRLTNC
ncbi:MAG: hypothetical protein WAN92_05080 [Herbaspirillum sp.]